MKKLISLIAILSFATLTFAAGPDDVNMALSNKGKVICKNIKLGVSKAKIQLSNGETIKMTINDLNSYYLNGRIFEKCPKIVDNKVTNDEVFMELIRYQNGMKVYKYSNYNYDLNKFVDNFYIFKGQKYMGPITVENKETLLPFFRMSER